MVDFIVRDFLAAREVKIRVDGLTVLRGESYSGKSSTFRAIHAACTNRFASGTVRWGASQSEVLIRFDGSSDVLRVVKPLSGGASYQLGSVKYDKTRREVPAEVESFLNLGVLVSGSDRLSLTFWEQFSRPLLRSFSQAKVSEMLGSGVALKDWGVCWKALSSRRSELRGEERVLKSLVDESKAQVDIYARLVDLGSSLALSVRRAREALLGLSSRVQLLQELRQLLLTRDVLEGSQGSRRACLSVIDGWLSLQARMVALMSLYGYLSSSSRVCTELFVLQSYSDVLRRHKELEVGFSSACYSRSMLSSLGGLLLRKSVVESQLYVVRQSCAVVWLRSLCLLLQESSVGSTKWVSLSVVRRTLDRLVLLHSLRKALSDRSLLEAHIDSLRARCSEDVCPVCGSRLSVVPHTSFG
jgi:hypothetical protein